MRKGVIIILLFMLSLGGFISAENWGYNYLEEEAITPGANYSINVNNTQYLRGYSPLTLRDWMQTTYDTIYCELTGCTMSGDINMDGNN